MNEVLDVFDQGKIVGSGGMTTVDDKVAMFFRDLGITDGKTLEI